MMGTAREGSHEHFSDEETAHYHIVDYGVGSRWFILHMHASIYCIGAKVCSVQYTVL